MFTPWGYQLEDELPPLVSADDFNAITGRSSTIDLEVLSVLNAVSQAIRNACGWHIAPSLDCIANLTASGKLVRLPAGYVSEISSLKENGVLLGAGEFEWRHDGLLRRCCFKNFVSTWDGIEVEYTAGYDLDAVPDLSHVVTEITNNIIALPKGVISESADGVSISYSMQAQSVANAMTEQFRAQLAPYRLVSSHAA